MKADLVSVITPIYNAEVHLNACLRSITGQTYRNLEIILVDDGSTDRSGDICREWAARDHRVNLVRKKHGGQSEARNLALDICKGKYIVFVDADDRVEPEYVAYLHGMITEYGANLAVCGFRFETPTGKPLNKFTDDGNVRVMNQQQALWELFDDSCISSSLWAKIFRTDDFRTVRFPEGHIFEDVATVYKLFMMAENAVYGRKALYHYIRREGSTGTKSFDWDRMDSVRYARQMCDAVSEKWPSLDPVAHKRLFIEYTQCMKAMSISGDRSLKMKTAFDKLYQELKGIRATAVKNRMTLKQRCYAVCSCFGKTALYLGFRLEAQVYQWVKLRK